MALARESIGGERATTERAEIHTGLALAMALLFVWPLPHTIALRHLLLIAAALWAGATALRARSGGLVTGPGHIWLAFVLWAGISGALPGNRFYSGDFAGQLLTATVAGFFGFMLGGRLIGAGRYGAGWAWLMLPLLVFAASTSWEGLQPWLTGGSLARRVDGLTEGPDKSNYLRVILVCWLLAEGWLRLRLRRRFTPLPSAALMAAGVVSAFTLYVEMIRNGLLSLGAAIAVLAAHAAAGQRTAITRRSLVWALILVVSFVALATSDPRWRGTWDSAMAAWNADTRAVVLGETAVDGSKDPSAFLRIAMIKEGLGIVAAHPLGIGFHRNAFGHGLAQTYGAGSGHSHSSLLDIAIGAGIPGLLLICAFLVSLFVTGWQAERLRQDGIGLLLALLAVATLARAALDSCLRDHMLQMTLFFFGILLGALTARGEKEMTR